MENTMKKFRFLMIPLLCAALMITVMAHSANGGVFEFSDEGKIVTFSENSTLSEEEQQTVAEYLVYGAPEDDGASTYAWCWLTGHNYTYDVVSVITHKKSAYSPRCLEETYNIETCTKCDHYSQELLTTVYIVCCPVD